MAAGRVDLIRTCLCEHAESFQHVNIPELLETSAYEITLYFIHNKNVKLQF